MLLHHPPPLLTVLASNPPLQAAPLPAPAAAAAAAGAWSGLERHRGKVALVTGAGSGVGWELATTLALAGLRVVAVSRRKSQVPRAVAAASRMLRC